MWEYKILLRQQLVNISMKYHTIFFLKTNKNLDSLRLVVWLGWPPPKE